MDVLSFRLTPEPPLAQGSQLKQGDYLDVSGPSSGGGRLDRATLKGVWGGEYCSGTAIGDLIEWKEDAHATRYQHSETNLLDREVTDGGIVMIKYPEVETLWRVRAVRSSDPRKGS